MEKILLGLVCGMAFGLLDVLIMLQMKFEDRRRKWEALGAAFTERFMIGFLVPNVALPLPAAVTGGMLGLTLSIPSALITRAYTPILGIGTVGGIVIGALVEVLL